MQTRNWWINCHWLRTWTCSTRATWKKTSCTVKRNHKISINMLEGWCWCCMYTHMLNLGRLVVDSVKAWCRRLGWNCVHAERPIPWEQLGQNWGSCFPSLNHGMKIAHDPCWTPVVPKWCWVYIIRSWYIIIYHDISLYIIIYHYISLYIINISLSCWHFSA
jgi:hypothetical protein